MTRSAMGSDPDLWADWAAWLADHGAALVLFARSFVSSAADAEDVVQDAFVRFWQARDRVDDPVAFLYRCVRHGALDWRRRQGRERRREMAAARPEAESWFTGTLEAAERRAVVQLALAALPENQREVLVLRLWGGLSFPQIAATLDAPVNTVTSRYRYALERLREQLAEEPIP